MWLARPIPTGWLGRPVLTAEQGTSTVYDTYGAETTDTFGILHDWSSQLSDAYTIDEANSFSASLSDAYAIEGINSYASSLADAYTISSSTSGEAAPTVWAGRPTVAAWAGRPLLESEAGEPARYPFEAGTSDTYGIRQYFGTSTTDSYKINDIWEFSAPVSDEYATVTGEYGSSEVSDVFTGIGGEYYAASFTDVFSSLVDNEVSLADAYAITGRSLAATSDDYGVSGRWPFSGASADDYSITAYASGRTQDSYNIWAYSAINLSDAYLVTGRAVAVTTDRYEIQTLAERALLTDQYGFVRRYSSSTTDTYTVGVGEFTAVSDLYTVSPSARQTRIVLVLSDRASRIVRKGESATRKEGVIHGR